MASPKSTLPNDEKEAQDSQYNPGEHSYREGMGAGYSGAGTDQAEAFANDPKNHDSNEETRKAEEGINSSDAPWKNEVSGQGGPRTSNRQRVVFFLKKRGAIIGILGILGIGGGTLAGFAGSSSLLVNLMENLSLKNDSSSTAFEKRFMKAFSNSVAGDPICANNTKIKCKMGSISNKAIEQLKGKGITAFPETDTSKKSGYPSENPKGYKIKSANGEINVKAEDLAGYLLKNPAIGARVLGVKGFVNLRVNAWTGKYITKKLLGKFNIEKNGGLADGKNKLAAGKDKITEILAKLRLKIPGLKGLDAAAERVKAKVGDKLGKAKKGGIPYTLAVAGCMRVKTPGIIAGAIAAVQLLQVLPIVNEVILSPASKLKASGVNPANAISPEDVDAIGSLLTTKAKGLDGKTGSPLDSQILLSAMGASKGKPAVSESFTPGYLALTNPIVLAANKLNNESRPFCNAIMSPASMYSATAIDAASTIALSPTIIGGLIKVVGSFVIQEVVSKVGEELVGATARQVLIDAASNDAIPKAQGKDLGDVLGISALSLFASNGMARQLPALKTSQVSAFTAMQKSNEDYQRQMDIATLSPFDTNSRYTFLGSIVYNNNMAAIASGRYGTDLFSNIANFARLPFAGLSTNAGASTDFTTASCGYAADFGLDTKDPNNTPAINAAGLPCTGLTDDQANMTTDEAMTLVSNEGWLDEQKDIAYGATIDDMVSSEYIKPNTPMTDFMESCSDSSTGDYVFNSASCTVSSTSKNPNSIIANKDYCGASNCAATSNTRTDVSDPAAADLKDPRSLQAISVLLVDFQLHQMINGEDDIQTTPAATAAMTTDTTTAVNISPDTSTMSPLSVHITIPTQEPPTNIVAIHGSAATPIARPRISQAWYWRIA